VHHQNKNWKQHFQFLFNEYSLFGHAAHSQLGDVRQRTVGTHLLEKKFSEGLVK
jgi:hypothetical protein